MASKKSGKKVAGKFGSKAGFIRSQPDSMPAKDVVEAAAKQGLKISVNHVYNLRTAAAKKEGDTKGSGLLTPKRGVGRPRLTGGSDVERQLRSAIAEIGLQRAREIFDAVAIAFRGR